jgi:hypothetical protein
MEYQEQGGEGKEAKRQPLHVALAAQSEPIHAVTFTSKKRVGTF